MQRPAPLTLALRLNPASLKRPTLPGHSNRGAGEQTQGKSHQPSLSQRDRDKQDG